MGGEQSLDGAYALTESRLITEYSGLSEKAEELLGSQESRELDFKESIGGLSADDLVAFANCESGGTILLGVRENQDEQGRQTAEIVGCEIGDRAKLSILGKAGSCVPPVELFVIVENTEGKKPFLRVSIPSGAKKPYSTSGGTYKIRGDARNNPLTPDLLLALFMDTENAQFINRFSQATQELESSLHELKSRLLTEMEEIYTHVDKLDRTLNRK
ncbi:MAG: ATP-binding protein [Candidatus Fermentibacteria bacterium]|nr:ATP-binding protein [Candidatus Fermentibacteria bacterium]